MGSCRKAIQFAYHLGFAIYFLMFLTYTYSYAMAGWLTFVQMYAVALFLSPKYRGLLSPAPTTDAAGPRVGGMTSRERLCLAISDWRTQ
jgi:hypothetical protein